MTEGIDFIDVAACVQIRGRLDQGRQEQWLFATTVSIRWKRI